MLTGDTTGRPVVKEHLSRQGMGRAIRVFGGEETPIVGTLSRAIKVGVHVGLVMHERLMPPCVPDPEPLLPNHIHLYVVLWLTQIEQSCPFQQWST